MMNSDLFAELQRRASEIDCLVAYDPEVPTQVNAYYQEKPLGVVLDDTLITCPEFTENAERNEPYYKMQALINEVSEYVAAYQKGTYPAYAALPGGYRSLTNYNGIFLAAAKMVLGGYQFVTWQLDERRTSFENGRYTTDYKEAKRNFAQRSGLVHKSELFSLLELQTIQSAVQYALENQTEISFDSSEQLRHVALKIANALPEPESLIWEEKGFEQTM